ncbi:MAG: Maf family protein [Planctomycetota bacterium]
MGLDRTEHDTPDGEADRAAVWLASSSPRRRDLLKGAGVRYGWSSPGIDDGELVAGRWARMHPEWWVAALAHLKARAGLAARARAGEQPLPVLGGDTVCVARGRIIGQPADEAEARATLGLLMSEEHAVLTGMALVGPEPSERDVFVSSATVRFGAIDAMDVENYVRSGQWRGKAGAYNLTERLEDGWPIAFEGEPGTIVGLPIEAVLRRWGARLKVSGATGIAP